MIDTTKPGGLTANPPGFVVAAGRAALLIVVGLVGCGPSEAEQRAEAIELVVERERLQRQIAELEARVRLLEEQTKQEREQVPSKHGPGDFPTHPPEPRWVPTAAPGEERPPRDPRPPFHGR